MSAISNALQDYRNIWRVMALQRTERTAWWMYRLALLLIGGGAIFVGVAIWRNQLDPWIVVRLLLGLGAFWGGATWVGPFASVSMRMNSAINARLVPRQRRRLLQMAAGGWLLLTLAFTVAAGTWTLFPLAGVYLLSIAMVIQTGNPRALAPIIVIGNWGWLSRRVLPPRLAEALAGDTAMVVCGVLLVPAAAWVLRRMYPAGGDTHFERHATLRRRIVEGRGGVGDPGNRSVRIYAAVLRRDSRHGPQRADAGRMLMHALGPEVHWSAWTGFVGVMLVLGIGIRLLLAWQESSRSLHDFMSGASLLGLGSLVLAILFATAAFSQAINRTRGEQALVRLAPLAGDATLLNRRLALQLLQRGLGLWAALTLAILCVSILVAGPAVLLRQFGLCCLAGQVAMMGLLGDYAGQGGWRPALAWRAGGLALLEVLAAVGLARVSGMSFWTWMAAIALAVAGFRLCRAWQGMLAAPVAFPARRLG